MKTPHVGDQVISWFDEDTVTYGGMDPNHDRGWASRKLNVRTCNPNQVAPADTPVPDTDPRAVIEQLDPSKPAPFGFTETWLLTLPGVEGQALFHTQTAAHQTAMRRLAILDHVAARH